MNRLLATTLALLVLGQGCRPGRTPKKESEAYCDSSTEDIFAVGRVASVTSRRVTLTECDADSVACHDWVYTVSPKTQLLNMATLSDLKKGDDVTLYYTFDGSTRTASFLARRPDEEAIPIPSATALKLGAYRLTQLFDVSQSEAGMDLAAVLYATAKRIQTEQSLAQRDLALVRRLNVWRGALEKCRTGSWDIASIYYGGGTAYGHGASRDAACLEDFLAYLATRLPFADGKGSAKADGKIDDAVAFLRGLKCSSEVDPEEAERSNERLPPEVECVARDWKDLNSLIGEIPAFEANEIASFAVESLKVLKETCW